MKKLLHKLRLRCLSSEDFPHNKKLRIVIAMQIEDIIEDLNNIKAKYGNMKIEAKTKVLENVKEDLKQIKVVVDKLTEKESNC